MKRCTVLGALVLAAGCSSGGELTTLPDGDAPLDALAPMPDAGAPPADAALTADAALLDATLADAAPFDTGTSSTVDGGLSADAGAAHCTAAGGGLPYSRYKWPFVGDLHLHTMNSLDAYSFATRARPSDAYLFARKMTSIAIGQATTATPGPTITIDRPLDFLAVTDHSEWLGLVRGCVDPRSSYAGSASCTLVRSTSVADQNMVFASLGSLERDLCSSTSPNSMECAAEVRSAWQEEQQAAADAYDPCHFTSFVAYEWTSSPNGDTHHRNVVFASAVVPPAPLDSIDYDTPESLWRGLDSACPAESGCEVMTIPHNTDLSNGTSLVLPSTPDVVPLMQKYQRLVEIYQHKGASECSYALTSTSDPFCRFEYVNFNNPNDSPQSYVRRILEDGLSYALLNPVLGDPYVLGIVGATDDHNGTPGHVVETDYTGHAGRHDDQPSKRLLNSPQNGPGGLTVAWAEENTREAIYAALRRRETYATSGPRFTVRFYQASVDHPCTADFPATIIDRGQGIPMGGTFGAADLGPAQTAPRFAIGAWPDTAPQRRMDGSTGTVSLYQVQVIKAHGKLDASGAPRVVEDPPFALSVPGTGGCIEWSDPSFDPAEQAWYYVRVLQQPTWRWSHYDCLADPTANPTGCGANGTLNRVLYERAWTSPLWFKPS
jgi:hypothetical protein